MFIAGFAPEAGSDQQAIEKRTNDDKQHVHNVQKHMQDGIMRIIHNSSEESQSTSSGGSV